MFFLFWTKSGSRLIQYKISHKPFLLSSLHQQSFDRCLVALYKKIMEEYLFDTNRNNSTKAMIFNSSFCDIVLFCGFPSVIAMTVHTPHTGANNNDLCQQTRRNILQLHSTSLCQGFQLQTLPKALRTQALTALTSNLGLVGLVQNAW